MKSKHAAQPEHSNRPTTQQPTTKTIPPSHSSAAGMVTSSILNNARNNNIRNNTFVTNVKGAPPSLDVLYKRAAPNAILNTGGRADEVRCHPGTREEIISRIEKWGNARDRLTAPIFWLSGPAGAGKSAIMQTIAERCNQRRRPQANFFFFRGDTTRSHASPLIATLIHQILLLHPSLRESVATLLSTNPLIFDATLEDQLAQLIITPLRSIQQSSPAYRPLMILIDGLDECDSETKHSQQQILHAFDKILPQNNGACPVRLLVASRDEPQIQAAFNKISSQCIRLYLDDQYHPEKDIRVFVNARFQEVRKTHPLAHTLDGTWPSVADINYIIEKSSGQFIYAATVMRFISDSSASPLVSLERVKGAARFATKSPFSHLDAIYTYILSQANDQDSLNDILSATILSTELQEDAHDLYTHLNNLSKFHFRHSSDVPIIPPPPTPPLELLPPPLIELLRPLKKRYTKAIILSCLGDLTSLCKFGPDSSQPLFYHASFADYLLDQSRSGGYFTDTVAFRYKILPVVWKLIDNGQRGKTWVDFGLCAIMRLKKLPPGLMSVLVPLMMESRSISTLPQIRIYVKISNLCIRDDDIIKFRHFMSQWITSENLRYLDFEEIKAIRFSHRYFQMARAQHFVTPDDEMAAALYPESDFDHHESALWLKTLLHNSYTKVYPQNTKQYTQLLKSWVSWAFLNDISCEGLLDLPNARRYIWWNTTKKWARVFKIGNSKK